MSCAGSTSSRDGEVALGRYSTSNRRGHRRSLGSRRYTGILQTDSFRRGLTALNRVWTAVKRLLRFLRVLTRETVVAPLLPLTSKLLRRRGLAPTWQNCELAALTFSAGEKGQKSARDGPPRNVLGNMALSTAGFYSTATSLTGRSTSPGA